MRRCTISLLTAALLLCGNAYAEAARLIFTPPLAPDTNGSLYCFVANTVDKPVTLVIDVLDESGNPSNQIGTVNSYASGNLSTAFAGSYSPKARFCRVTVTEGNAKNLRVTLEARSAQGVPTVAVEAR